MILYGYVPALSYYLQMPPAFNAWSDLRSYSYETMVDDLAEVERQIREENVEKPVVLVDYTWDVGQDLNWKQVWDLKWELIEDFMERNGYELTWQNNRFAFYE